MTSILSLGPDAQRQVREQLARAQNRCPKCNTEIGCHGGCDCGYCSPKIDATLIPKYKNRKTVYRSTQGFERCYDSKLEARIAQRYDDMVAIGRLRCWVPQIPFLLPGGVRLVVDFMLIWKDGSVSFTDAKGRETQASINKRKQVKAIYGIDVEIVTK